MECSAGLHWTSRHCQEVCAKAYAGAPLSWADLRCLASCSAKVYVEAHRQCAHDASRPAEGSSSHWLGAQAAGGRWRRGSWSLRRHHLEEACSFEERLAATACSSARAQCSAHQHACSDQVPPDGQAARHSESLTRALPRLHEARARQRPRQAAVVAATLSSKRRRLAQFVVSLS